MVSSWYTSFSSSTCHHTYVCSDEACDREKERNRTQKKASQTRPGDPMWYLYPHRNLVVMTKICWEWNPFCNKAEWHENLYCEGSRDGGITSGVSDGAPLFLAEYLRRDAATTAVAPRAYTSRSLRNYCLGKCLTIRFFFNLLLLKIIYTCVSSIFSQFWLE